jgi:hypothetical protein
MREVDKDLLEKYSFKDKDEYLKWSQSFIPTYIRRSPYEVLWTDGDCGVAEVSSSPDQQIRISLIGCSYCEFMASELADLVE